MSLHYKTICTECNKTINQCRCQGEKPISYDVCGECAETTTSNAACMTKWHASNKPTGIISFVGLRQHFTPRTVRHENRDHIIAPIVMLTEGVHTGVCGVSKFYSAGVIAHNAIVWNGVPVTIQHPMEQGRPVSANSPNVAEQQTIGKMYNVQWDGSKLRGEAWIDVLKAEATEGGREVLDIVRNGGDAQLEVSTGLFDELSAEGGSWNQEQYAQAVERIHPDHLALLPGATGACSWADGCGMRANCRFTDIEEDGIVTNKNDGAAGELGPIEQLAERVAGELTEAKADPKELKAVAARFARQMGFDVNEIGHEAISNDLRRLVDSWDRTSGPGSRVIHYLKEVFSDNFIYSQERENQERKIFRLPYTIVNDQVVVDEGVEPEEVVMKTEFVPVNNSAAPETIIIANNETGEALMKLDVQRAHKARQLFENKCPCA